MNNIIVEDIKSNKDIYIFDNSDNDRVYNVDNDCLLRVFHYNVNANSKVEINLNNNNARVEYYYSTINYDNNLHNITVKHNANSTASNIYNHGVNVGKNKLHFDVCGQVIKDKEKCTCNQENQIINLKDGNSTILPILLIDNYDVSSSHSAYIGEFSEDKLFYLMSRGIDRNMATRLLLKALLVNVNNDSKELQEFTKEIEKI